MIGLAPSALRGSFPPLVTPFTDGGDVDYATYAALVEHHVQRGSHGIVVTGTTGEPSLLSSDERVRLFEVAVKSAAGRIQVIAATGAQNHDDTIRMTVAAERAGADAVLIVTPYFVRPPQRGLIAYYTDLCGRIGLPAMIYHIPGRAAVNLSVDSIAAIAEAAPNLVGVKHAANDLALVSELLIRLGMDFRVHVGLEELSFPMLCIGASGLMNAVGNLTPGKVADLYAAVARGDLQAGRALHFALHELNQSVFFDTNPIPMKYMMKRIGLLPNECHRLPMVPAAPDLARNLDAVLERAGLL